MLKCKQQCHGACSSEIGTCKINDDVRQAAHTKKKTAQKQRENTFYAHVLKVNINFQRKKKLSIFFYQTHF
jgi:hypothetical protein